jgi:hypothetical protein
MEQQPAVFLKLLAATQLLANAAIAASRVGS